MRQPTTSNGPDTSAPREPRAATQVRVSFFGASFDTGNLGVAALLDSTITGLAARIADLDLTTFDHGRGTRERLITHAGKETRYRGCGARWSRRIYRRDTLPNIRFSARLGGLGNDAAQRILRSHAVLDISGGDSFTDLYGAWRLKFVNMPKSIALENGIPLVLLPQTYGPFTDPTARRNAAGIVRRAALAWARDDRSLEVMKDLLGADYDPSRHREGVDVAFLLDTERPKSALPQALAGWMAEPRRAPIVGLNISGLILNRPDSARSRFNLRADYQAAMLGLVRRFLRESDARIVLVPHVFGSGANDESDPAACAAVLRAVSEEAGDRCVSIQTEHDQREMKWIISQCDWFCGTRMHATIAGLSSGVPTAAVSYSPKTIGVFETCGQGGRVADPCALDTQELTDHVWASWQCREESRISLRARLPGVIARANAQMDAIADFCRAAAESSKA